MSDLIKDVANNSFTIKINGKSVERDINDNLFIIFVIAVVFLCALLSSFFISFIVSDILFILTNKKEYPFDPWV